MELLKALPAPLKLRQESVDAPELGGAVVVRGLLASEAFAVAAYRSQALRRALEESRQRGKAKAAGGDSGDGGGDAEAGRVTLADLDFAELVAYGRYVSHLLSCAVVLGNGMQVYSADQWEVCGQHHPALVRRLQQVAERLSGLDAEDVEKN